MTIWLLLRHHDLLPAHLFGIRDAYNSSIYHVLLKTKLNCITIIPQSTLTDHKSVILCINKEPSRKYTYKTHNRVFKDVLRKDRNFCSTILKKVKRNYER